MGTAWFLVAWDPAGGRGLASRREARQTSIPLPAELPKLCGSPTIYVGPPGFEPELVTKPSIALSAGRSGYFLQRVPTEGPEAAFPSARAVAEFVRRSFVGGGGTRGGGAGGGEQAPEGEPPAPSGPPDLPAEAAASLRAYCLECGEVVERLEAGAGATDDVPQLSLEPAATWSSETDPVYWGAVELVGSMLEAYPTDWRDAGPAGWLRAATSLGFALQELDLWRMLAVASRGDRPASRLERLVRAFLKAHGRPPEPPKDYFPRDFANVAWTALAVGPGVGQQYAFRNVASRYEALFTWPVPRYLEAALLTGGEPTAGVPTVGQLLGQCVATPIAFKVRPELSPAYCVVSFAAAFLASSVVPRTSGDWRIRAAHAWLTRSLPRWLFEPRLESLIAEAARQANHEPRLAGALG